MLEPRAGHSTCAIQSDDGSTKCILIIGGFTYAKKSKTTEILYLTKRNWIHGPRLPVEIESAACVAHPPTSNFACVIVGGSSINSSSSSSNVYGLDKSLSKWTLLGKIRNERYGHIALPIS